MGRMYHEKKRNWRPLALLLAAAAVVALLCAPALVRNWSGDLERQSDSAVRAAVLRHNKFCKSRVGVFDSDRVLKLFFINKHVMPPFPSAFPMATDHSASHIFSCPAYPIW
jgi:hypothetical protein